MLGTVVIELRNYQYQYIDKTNEAEQSIVPEHCLARVPRDIADIYKGALYLWLKSALRFLQVLGF